jgi:hypothetical protein
MIILATILHKGCTNEFNLAIKAQEASIQVRHATIKCRARVFTE